MLPEVIEQWEKNKHTLQSYFATTKQSEYSNEYKSILKKTFELCLSELEYDSEKITVVDNGDYQGTQLFLIPKETYQPSVDDYLITSVDYGSCSGCDTLQAINDYSEDLPTDEQVKDYMMLSLHLVQKLKKIPEA